MAEFRDLPVELLSDIIQYLVKPAHLNHACLVNRLFYQAASQFLYRHVFLAAWHKNAKSSVVQLFQTLEQNKQLALYVRRLDIRAFPKPAPAEVITSLLRGLSNCLNLISCTWTRDGSLNSALLETLQHLPHLSELEINGNNEGQYDAAILQKFSRIKKIRMIMPKPYVVNILPRWIEATRNGITSLTLICNSSPLITDEFLTTVAPYLTHLEHFSLTGCIRVTHRGVFSVLAHNEPGIKVLCLENMSPHFDVSEFSINCTASKLLHNLSSITLTIPEDVLNPSSHLLQSPENIPNPKADLFYQSLYDLLLPSNLTHFQLYATQPWDKHTETDTFFDRLILAHGHRLKRITLHRMSMGPDTLYKICKSCQALEEFFFVIQRQNLNNLYNALPLASNLRTLHLNTTQFAEKDDDSDPTSSIVVDGQRQRFTHLIHICSPTLVQFGCNAKVWKVGREITTQDGKQVVNRILLPYEGLNIPEAFLVVRT